MCDRRLLDFPGAALYSANLPVQPALAGASDMGTGIPFILDAILRLGSAHVTRALAWQKTLPRAAYVPQSRSTPASVRSVALLHIWLFQSVNVLMRAWSNPSQRQAPLWALLVGLGATNIMVYWAIVAVSQAINYFRKYQERELRLSQAELQALRSQLHPHFLFNTLNAIAELVYSDPVGADRSILRLSELLRFSLASEKAQEVTLKEEIEFLEKYVEIHKTLMRDRLNVRLYIDPETLDAAVPNMILQPLVENAIKHGISPRPEGDSYESVGLKERTKYPS